MAVRAHQETIGCSTWWPVFDLHPSSNTTSAHGAAFQLVRTRRAAGCSAGAGQRPRGPPGTSDWHRSPTPPVHPAPQGRARLVYLRRPLQPWRQGPRRGLAHKPSHRSKTRACTGMPRRWSSVARRRSTTDQWPGRPRTTGPCILGMSPFSRTRRTGPWRMFPQGRCSSCCT